MTDDELRNLMMQAGFVNDKHSPYIAHGYLDNFRKLVEAAREVSPTQRPPTETRESAILRLAALL